MSEREMPLRVTMSIAAAALLLSPASAQIVLEPQQATAELAAGPIDPERLYLGWRAKQLIDARVQGWNGEELGSVKDIVFTAEGEIEDVVVEGGGLFGIGDAVFRIPWERIDLTPGKTGIMVPLTKDTVEELGLHDGADSVILPPGLFRATDVIGNPARLQSLVEFGTLADLVFSRDGRALGVLIRHRDEAGNSEGGLGEESGGDRYAFAYPFDANAIIQRSDDISFYALPFDSMDAAASASRIAYDRFDDGLI
jgi:hypothetical protein